MKKVLFLLVSVVLLSVNAHAGQKRIYEQFGNDVTDLPVIKLSETSPPFDTSSFVPGWKYDGLVKAYQETKAKEHPETIAIESQIYNSDSVFDTIKRKVSPKSYWKKKVEDLEWFVKFTAGSIKESILERKKILATKDIVIAQAGISARSVGDSSAMAKKEAREEIREDLQVEREIVKEERKALRCYQIWLRKAREEFANCE